MGEGGYTDSEMFDTVADLSADVKACVPEAAREIFRKAFNEKQTELPQHLRDIRYAGYLAGYRAVEAAGYKVQNDRLVKIEADGDERFAVPMKVAGAVDDANEDPLIQKIATGQPITKADVLKLADIYEGDDETLIKAHGGARGRKWISRLLHKIGGKLPTITEMSGLIDVSSLPSPEEAPCTVTLRGQISKIDEDRRLVFGWFSVASENGVPVVDLQKDTISEEELEKTAYDVVRNGIKAGFSGGEMHTTLGVGELVESMVFTKAKQDALGIDLGMVGWWGGFYISDDETWAGVKSGKYADFSISGTGRRSATTDTAA